MSTLLDVRKGTKVDATRVLPDLAIYLNWSAGAGLPGGGLYELEVCEAAMLFALQANDPQHE